MHVRIITSSVLEDEPTSSNLGLDNRYRVEKQCLCTRGLPLTPDPKDGALCS